MQRIKEEAGKLLKLVREYPITTASITVATITFLLIRRYHSKFLVHPSTNQ